MMAIEWTSIRRIVPIFCCVVLAGPFSGSAFGPRILEKTHGRYQDLVRQVDEEQLLRNIVHLRYSEVPLELNVSSIATQYELAGSADARPFFSAEPQQQQHCLQDIHVDFARPLGQRSQPVPPSRSCQVILARQSRRSSLTARSHGRKLSSS